jgi:hypothetical protein
MWKLRQEGLRAKRRIVGTIAKIGTKENISPLHGGKVNLILIGCCTNELSNSCGNLPIKWPDSYCTYVDENKPDGNNIDIRYGFRFARRSELEIDDIKSISGNKKYQKIS